MRRFFTSPRRLLIPCGLFVVLVANHAVYAGAQPLSRKSAVQPVVNVNTATVAQLCYLPGVGPKLAAAIVAARPYKSIEALDAVKGIGAAKLAKMRTYVVLMGATTATGKIKPAKVNGIVFKAPAKDGAK